MKLQGSWTRTWVNTVETRTSTQTDTATFNASGEFIFSGTIWTRGPLIANFSSLLVIDDPKNKVHVETPCSGTLDSSLSGIYDFRKAP